MQNTEGKKEEPKAQEENAPAKSNSFINNLLDWADLYSSEEEPEEVEEHHESSAIANPEPAQELNASPSQQHYDEE